VIPIDSIFFFIRRISGANSRGQFLQPRKPLQIQDATNIDEDDDGLDTINYTTGEALNRI